MALPVRIFSFKTVEKKHYEGNIVQDHTLMYAFSISMINVIICLFVFLFIFVAVKFVSSRKEGLGGRLRSGDNSG